MSEGNLETADSKEKLWQEKSKEIDIITDRLGMPIDEGIKEMVIALQLLGINTTASHEGKLDRHPIPYIDIESSDPEKDILEEKSDELFDSDRNKNEEELNIIDKKILRLNLEERKKIIILLEEFYQNRKVPFESRLGLHVGARGKMRLQSQGADFQEIEEDEKIKAERLKAFQDEMNAFKDFLKQKFLCSQ